MDNAGPASGDPIAVPTWRVNSYSYPNPFQDPAPGHGLSAQQERALASWKMFESFVERPSYASVKAYWDGHPTRAVRPHAVESWKANFEEFGLLYVLSTTDDVVITPGGRQLLAAAQARDEREFAWVALNLIFRYPVRGEAGRRSQGEEFAQSDLLLYWFVHAALVELEGFWQQELFRVLAHVFRRAEAQVKLDLVRQIRNGQADIAHFLDPSGGRAGGVYNALNQVLNHGSLNHMLFTSTRQMSRYFPNTKENWWCLRDEYRDIVELALGGQGQPLPAGCAAQASLMQRIPAAPNYDDEQSYFNYIGMTVTPLADVQVMAQAAAAPVVDYRGESVFLLTEGQHFARTDANHIVGPVYKLCVLAEEARVILSDDLDRTYMVERKELAGNEVVIRLRRARPIIDRVYVAALFAGGTGV